MSKDQLLSVVRTALKVAGGALIAHGYTETGNILNTEDVIGAVLIISGAIWSHYSAKSTTTP